jgi:hypothetical protein
LHRQIGRLLTLENAVNIRRYWPPAPRFRTASLIKRAALRVLARTPRQAVAGLAPPMRGPPSTGALRR